jgi:hypothetical protein
MLEACLHPIWIGGKRDGYVYNVIFNGKLLVERSRDPECDAARALVALGITQGKLLLGNRTIINIAKAAKLTVSEESRGLRWKRKEIAE